jgi:hypothetical protein
VVEHAIRMLIDDSMDKIHREDEYLVQEVVEPQEKCNKYVRNASEMGQDK